MKKIFAIYIFVIVGCSTTIPNNITTKVKKINSCTYLIKFKNRSRYPVKIPNLASRSDTSSGTFALASQFITMREDSIIVTLAEFIKDTSFAFVHNKDTQFLKARELYPDIVLKKKLNQRVYFNDGICSYLKHFSIYYNKKLLVKY